MWSDNQMSKRNNQATKHEINVDGAKTVVYIRRGACEGVRWQMYGQI